MDQPVYQEKSLLFKVLVVKQAHGAVELDVGKGVPLPARLAFVVQHGHVGVVPHLPALLLDAKAQVQIFGVHEKALVEQASLGQGLGPDEHKGPYPRVDLGRRVRRQERHIVTAKTPAVREKAAQAKEPVEGHFRCGKTTPASPVQAAILSHQPWTGYPGLGMGFHESQHVGQGQRRQQGIGVEKQGVPGRQEIDRCGLSLPSVCHCRLSAALKTQGLQPQVVACGIAPVFGADQTHLRELGSDHVGAAIARVVVDDTDLKGEIALAGIDRRQAVAQQVAHVIVDDNDSQIEHTLP
jgi:hypothetical protein